MTRDFHITGADVLWHGAITDKALSVAGGLLTEAPAGVRIDLPGTLILPGIVDPHGDGFERHLAPRRGALPDLGDALAMVGAELAANGITTAMLAQFYSWEGGMRGPAFAARMLAAHAAQVADQPVDMRVQLRLETHLLDDFAAFDALAAQYDVGYVVFNDHIPHAALDKGKRPPRLTGQALKSGRSPEAHLAFLKSLHARKSEVPAALDGLIAALSGRGVLLGSHDDATARDREVWRARGVGISEFPETTDAAESAEKAGEAIVLGGPNVVRGGSHAGKVSAEGLIARGLCRALASDYHYPAPRQAAWKLAATMGLPAAWALVSEGPAGMLGLADRGRLAAGLRADFIVVDPANGRPLATFAAGRPAWLGPRVAQALLAGWGRPGALSPSAR
ncbi:alpha-D-ribose 1-methylphosphonate 5-triphosphate diphosphatase [Pseudooceanicola aestuarii]|uniref:alpha-D-ribose 1-methylphosphonate 5-triphosphate diphosphatase n=1 Tax=Pseudooceanicola aestuarii TaxID=2697319 RepID=UPI0013D29170|nr:alpha-D-ribose 1-methylphosphonate 5-triphosphate diphosphatase [Pseudooceanicola aestuarii]